jgi:hypothetical protein
MSKDPWETNKRASYPGWEDEDESIPRDYGPYFAEGRKDSDVHTEHCCIVHGCKYAHRSDRRGCTVASGEKVQSHPCEYCAPWSREWPTTPGLYWLYGYRTRFTMEGALLDKEAPSKAPALYLVEVWNSSGNSPMYVTSGTFVSPEEGGGGFWIPALIPHRPAMPLIHLDGWKPDKPMPAPAAPPKKK